MAGPLCSASRRPATRPAPGWSAATSCWPTRSPPASAEHARFGGVVPEVASRAHLEAMVPAVDRALATAGVTLADVDAIAVTAGPGLAGALLVGVCAAKAYALALDKPLYGVNHLAAHVAVDQLEHGPLPIPVIALLVSGGHSSLLLVPGPGRRRGPAGRDHRRRRGRGVRQGGPGARACRSPAGRTSTGRRRPATRGPFRFPRGKYHDGTADFSFSGLKTAVARWVEAREAAGEPVPVADVAASFQEAVADVLTRKAIDACRAHDVGHLVIGGGVAANSRLRALAARALRGGRDRAAGAPARPVHRQRGHGRGARRVPARPRRGAVPGRVPGRLEPAGDQHPGLSRRGV